MLTLITAPPGTGKSLLAVRMLVEAAKAGRQAFADIAGLDVLAIQQKYGGPLILPAPEDWRDTPEGSLVVYDEAQGRFPSTGKPGRPDDPILQALEKHRHSGHDIVFVTQAPTFVHHHIRKLIGVHLHLHRAMGRKGAIVYRWEGQCGDFDDFHSRAKADQENFSYPKELFALYKSATVHTHKRTIPKKLVFIAAAILLVLSWPAYRVATGQFLDFDGEAVAADAAGLSASAPQAHSAMSAGGGAGGAGYTGNEWASAPSVPVIAGCVGTEKTCRCFGEDGNQLDLELAQCLNVLTKPLPINVFKFRGSANYGPEPAAASAPVGGDSPR